MTTTQSLFRTAVTTAEFLWSDPVKPLALHWDEATRSIRVVCSDANMRVCRIDRMSSINAARNLYKDVTSAIEKGSMVSFAAAGGFSPDKWFCDIK